MRPPFPIMTSIVFVVPILFFSLDCSAQVTTADLEGRILDQYNTGLSNAPISARNTATGIVRESVSASNGRYRFSALDPGIYDVTVGHDDYATELYKKVILELGRVVRFDFKLARRLEATESIEVVARIPMTQTTESTVPTVINEKEIESLPLNSRNVVELALLAPGVSSFRSNTPAFSPLNFGANNNRSTRVYVDGIDFSSDMLGGILPSGSGVSQNAVEQFEVITHGFKAEYGLTNAGIINLLTKAGTNEFHGSVFGFFRDDSLNSSFFEGKDPYERQQFGFALGGPLVRNRSHFFLAFENNREDNSVRVNTRGTFPEIEGSFILPIRNVSFLMKADHQISSAQLLNARYSYGNNRNDSSVGGTLAESNGMSIRGNLNAVLLSHKWIPSDRLLTELSVGYVQSDFDIEPQDDGPHLIYPSVELGRFPGGEQRLNEDRWQFRGDASYFISNFHGQHNWKFGVDISRVKTKEFFDSLSTGLFIFTSDTAPLPLLAVIGDGNPDYAGILNYKFAVYLQDDWSLLENLTLNLGLRYDIETNATNQNYVSSKTDPQLPFIVKGDRPVDQNNLAPRIGFAWDPFRNGKTAVRGNYGIFYGRVPTDFANGEIKSDQYSTYVVFQPGTTNKDEISLEGLPYQIEWLLPNRVPVPFTRQFSVGFSRELTQDLALDVDYVGIRGYHEYFARRDVNPPDPVTRNRPLPQYLEVFLLATDGRSNFDALEIVLRKRIGQRYQLRGSYTLSKAENDFDEPHFAGQLFRRGPAGWDERHRLTVDGIFSLPLDFSASCIVTFASGRPFNVFTGNDENLNGDLNDDQPKGVGRNSERAEGYSNVDLRMSKRFGFSKYQLELIADFFNLFNHKNFDPGSYVGNSNSPNFGEPTAILAPRQIQLGVKFNF